jgi:hypothetical protein
MSENSGKKPSDTVKMALSASNYLHLRMSSRMAGIVAAVGASASKAVPNTPPSVKSGGKKKLAT